jgi:hypothetical protein
MHKGSGMNLGKLVISTLALTSLARVASADVPAPQDYDDVPVRAPSLVPITARAANADLKNEDTALAWSLGGTAASVGMMVIGAKSNNGELAVAGALSSLITPSLGEWYAGQYMTWGMGLRAAGLVSMTAGAVDSFCWDNCDQNKVSQGRTLLTLGMIGYIGGALVDIAGAPHAARSYNEAHASHLSFAPTALRSGSTTAYGVGVGGSF